MNSRTNWLLGVATVVVATGALAAPAAARPLAKSAFNDNAEGWKAVGDVATDPEKPDHIDLGGDPGAFIQISDQAIGGVMYWRAPVEFRGNQKEAYKGSLSYSLTQSATDSPKDDHDISIKGAGRTIVNDDCCVAPEAFPAWTSYSVSLAKTDWYDVDTLDPVTGAQMKAVLSDIDRLLIRAEYRSGDDTDGLDTVKLTKPD